jgi:hypothetical protein
LGVNVSTVNRDLLHNATESVAKRNGAARISAKSAVPSATVIHKKSRVCDIYATLWLISTRTMTYSHKADFPSMRQGKRHENGLDK